MIDNFVVKIYTNKYLFIMKMPKMSGGLMILLFWVLAIVLLILLKVIFF